MFNLLSVSNKRPDINNSHIKSDGSQELRKADFYTFYFNVGY